MNVVVNCKVNVFDIVWDYWYLLLDWVEVFVQECLCMNQFKVVG